MPVFIYEAKLKTGEKVTDTIEAENEHAVISRLQAEGYFPLKVRLRTDIEVKKGRPEKNSHARAVYQRISGKEFAAFTRQLASLLNAGVPLLKSLEVLIRQTKNERLKKIIETLRNDVRDGTAFSEAIKKHPKVFPNLYIGMIRAGEAGGVLDTVLNRLAEWLEKEEDLRRQVRSSMAYPVVMALVGIGTVLFLLGYVIPKFVTMFEDIGRTLPLPTRILISLSNHIRSWWFLYIIGVVIIVSVLSRYVKTKDGKFLFDRVKLQSPVFGGLLNKIVLSRFTRTLGTLIGNGVPLLSALGMTRDTLGNEVFASEINKSYVKVEMGESLAGTLSKSEIFPPIVIDMIAVGEETGNLPDALVRIADTNDREVESSVKALTSLIEPVMILVMGTIVGFIVMAMLLPVFEMSAFVK
jgi:type II secretion system protein F